MEKLDSPSSGQEVTEASGPSTQHTYAIPFTNVTSLDKGPGTHMLSPICFNT